MKTRRVIFRLTLDVEQHWYASDGTPLDTASIEELVSAAQLIEWNELLTASVTGEELTNWNLRNLRFPTLILYPIKLYCI